MAREGNLAKWFEEEVQVHDRQLKSYLQHRYPAADVEDIVQESLLRTWLRHSQEPILFAKSFLFTIAQRLALNNLRKQRNSPFVAVAEEVASRVTDGNPDAAEQACSREELMLLFTAIDQLPGRCREVYILRKLKGRSQKEIAAELGISEGTVQTQIVRANRKCGEFLRARGVIE